MATSIPSRPIINKKTKKTRITIIASEYNKTLSTGLLKNTEKELTELLPDIDLTIHRVPGAFEVPVGVEYYLQNTPDNRLPDAIICLGVIIRGKTAHGDLIAQSVTTALQEQAVRHTLPILNEVLLVDDKKQAYARCVSKKLNRGIEAARAACRILESFRTINKITPRASMRMHPSQS